MTLNRASEPGWKCISMHDPSGRRGVWFRVNSQNSTIEICAGREGDDWYSKIEVGNIISINDIKNLAECLSVGSWMLGQ